jgi:hypothetical protein
MTLVDAVHIQHQCLQEFWTTSGELLKKFWDQETAGRRLAMIKDPQLEIHKANECLSKTEVSKKT